MKEKIELRIAELGHIETKLIIELGQLDTKVKETQARLISVRGGIQELKLMNKEEEE